MTRRNPDAPPAGMKRCARCREWKPRHPSYFDCRYKRKTGHYQFFDVCRECSAMSLSHEKVDEHFAAVLLELEQEHGPIAKWPLAVHMEHTRRLREFVNHADDDASLPRRWQEMPPRDFSNPLFRPSPEALEAMRCVTP